MLTQKEKKRFEEQELFEEIAYVQEMRHYDDMERHAKKGRGGFFVFLFVLIGLAFIGGAIYVNLFFVSNPPEQSYVVPVTALIYGLWISGGLVILLGIGITIRRKFRDIRPVREDLAPEYTPDKKFRSNGSLPLVQGTTVRVRKVKDDPSRRKSQYDPRKAARSIDLNITFPKMSQALIASFGSLGYVLDENESARIMSRLAFGRIFLIRGKHGKDAQVFFEAVRNAFEWEGEFAQAGNSFQDFVLTHNITPSPKSTFLVGLEGLGATDIDRYFHGFRNHLIDASQDHVLANGKTLSKNAVFFVFLNEGDDQKGVSDSLLRYSIFYKPQYAEMEENTHVDPSPIKVTSDEIRYLATKFNKYYLSSNFDTSMEVFPNFEIAHGKLMPNDADNSIQRFESVSLLFNLEEEDLVVDLLVNQLLPFYYSAYSEEQRKEEGGLTENMKHEFIASKLQGAISDFEGTFQLPKKEEDSPKPEPEPKPVPEVPVEEPAPEAPSPEAETPEAPVDEPVDNEPPAAEAEEPAPEEPEVPEEPVEKNPDLDGWEIPTDEDKPGKGGDQ